MDSNYPYSFAREIHLLYFAGVLYHNPIWGVQYVYAYIGVVNCTMTFLPGIVRICVCLYKWLGLLKFFISVCSFGRCLFYS